MIELADTVLFKDVNMESIAADLKYDYCNYSKGCVISEYRQRNIGVMLGGSMKIKKYLEDGRGFLLRELNAGDIFGVSRVFNESFPVLGDFECTTDCSIAYIDEQVLMHLFMKEPAILKNYLHLLNTKIGFLNSRIDLIRYNDVKDRLYAYLHELRTYQGHTDYAMLYHTKAELAEMLAIGRTSLYRAFDKLEQSGAIEVRGNRVRLFES